MKALKGLVSVLALSLLALFPSSASAQTEAAGAIAGTVKDTTGAVLPGVTVEAASPALIEKVRTAVSDAQGNYKIVDLRPGTYTVTFTLPGFSTFKRDGIQLSTGFTAQANAEMKVGALEETVTVTGASPVVDTQNVRTQNVLTHEVLETLPTSRGVSGFAAMTVGATVGTGLQDVGGNRNDQYGFMNIHGSSGGRQNFDGMDMNNMIGDGGGSSRHFLVNQAAIQETVIQTSGMNAESGLAGANVNVVPKDGGNKYSLYFMGTGTNHTLQSTNIDDFLRSRGVTAAAESKKIYDVGGGIGGPIKKDKIWFYASPRTWGSQEYIPRQFINATPHTMFFTPDTSQRANSDYYQADYTGRVTWQVSRSNKIAVHNAFQRNCQCNYYLEQGTVTPEATVDYPYYPIDLTQVTWSHPQTNKLLFESGFSRLRNGSDPRPGLDTVLPTDIAITEQSTALQYNSYAMSLGAASYGTAEDYGQINGKFAVSYVTGSHAFKTGIYALHGVQNYPYLYINQSLSYTFNNRVPVSLTEWASPSANLATLDLDLGLYAQDQWTMKRATFNLGLRYDQVKGSYPDQTRPGGRFVGPLDIKGRSDLPNFKDLSPRFGLAYDLFGNGRTAIKGSVGRYVLAVGPGTAAAVNPASSMTTSTTRTWNDSLFPVGDPRRGNYTPDCDLSNTATNGECGPITNSRFGQVNVVTTYANDVLGGFGNRQYNWEGSALLQQELRAGMAVQVAYYQRWFGNFQVTQNAAVTAGDFSSYCVTAPTSNSGLPTAGQQFCGLYDINPNRLAQSGTANVVTLASNFGDQSQVFKGLDITMNARFGKGGILQGGVGMGRTVTDNCYAKSRPDLNAIALTTPHTDDFCHVAPPISSGTQFKLSASYPLPFDLKASAVYQNLAGIQDSATVVYTNAQVAASLGRNLAACPAGAAATSCTATAVDAVLPPGQLYEQRLNQLDLRFSKVFRFGSHARVTGMFDIYNATNDNTILLNVGRFGATWRNPSQFLAPRLFKLGGQMDW